MVWGGATLDAIARLRSQQGSISSKRSSIRPYELGGSPPREAFDCMFLCGTCGYLCDSDPPCPSCGESSWIDLDYWAHAEALRAREEEERRHPPRRLAWQVRLTSLATGAAIGVGCAAGLALAGLVAFGWPALLGLGAGATAMTHGLGRRRFGRSIMERRPGTATRWRLPLPLTDANARTAARAVGRLEVSGGLLRAPFSGRPCVGYALGVMFDSPSDAWPPIWVLREMRSSAFEVEGRAVATDGVWLALPTTRITAPALDQEQLRRFLRERGLFLVDGQFDLYEAILEPGDSYELLWPTAPAGAPPFIRAAGSAPVRDPYR